MCAQIRYEERNGRRYAYVATSKRVPGKNNPVSVKEYLGVVDSETGEIVPKRPRRSAVKTRMEDGLNVKSYGDVLIVLSVLERSGVIRDLTEVFGDSAKDIIAIAAAEALNPSCTNNIFQTIRFSCLCDILEIEDARFSVSEIRRSINRISSSDVWKFIESRLCGSENKVLIYGIPVTLAGYGGESLNGIRGSRFSEFATMAVMFSTSGHVVGYRLIDAPLADVSSISSFVSEVEGIVPRCVYFSDSYASQFFSIDEFILDGISFIVAYGGSSEICVSAFELGRDLISEANLHEHDGKRYYMQEFRAGMVHKDGRYSFVDVGGPGNQDMYHVTGFFYYDPKISIRYLDNMMFSIKEFKRSIEGRDIKDAESMLASLGGPMAKCLRLATGSDGKVKVTIRRSELSKLREESGRYLVLTSGVGWEDVVAANAIKTRIISGAWQFKRSPWVLDYTSRGVSMEGQHFIEFLAIIVYTEIQNILDSNGSKLTVEEVLDIASSYKLIQTDGGYIRSARSRRVPGLFKMFDIIDPMDYDGSGRISDFLPSLD